jgi:hypothetical protein
VTAAQHLGAVRGCAQSAPPLVVLGIDPGLEKSAWALVAFGDARPHLLATGEALTPELDPEALRRGLDRLLL